MLKARAKNILYRLASPLLHREQKKMDAVAASYQQMIEKMSPRWDSANFSCEGIVFSRDRAMQLHALLSSYFTCVKNPAPLTVLYTCSNNRHEQSYNELKALFAAKSISFVREQSFKKDLENILGEIKSSTIFFMTDDGIFIDDTDFDLLRYFDPLIYVPSLIKGLDLTYCYIQDRQQSLPPFIETTDSHRWPAGTRCWNWRDGEPGSDWAYPLSLDLSFYRKDEMEIFIRNLSYQAPNSLESALHDSYQSIFFQRKGICFEKAKYVNIVCNVVNTEHANRNSGLHSIDSLLAAWEAGKRIRFEEFIGKNCGEVEQAAFSFVER